MRVFSNMRIFFPCEGDPHETRVAATPATIAKLQKLGASVILDKNFASGSFVYPAELRHNGQGYPECDLIVTVGRPTDAMVAAAPKGATWLGLLNPFADAPATAARYQQAGISALSLENLPRSTIAQKMDALSSQANIAGYAAVLKASALIDKVFPMMMTPAGTLQPSRVFVIGVGVAGLQAIATAKRLGSRIEAFDTRPVVEDQVKSLGAKFVKIDLGGETGQSAQGYAKELTPEQLQRQKEEMAKVVAQSDVVITTAKLFGRKPPLLVSQTVLEMMRPGAVVIDMACVAPGVGNVEGSMPDQVVTTANGVKVYGGGFLERMLPRDASEMYAANVANFIEHFWNKQTKTMDITPSHEILKGMFIAQSKETINA
jgi:H+-translocating NAD(P) transhydrogenase subunit alpha